MSSELVTIESLAYGGSGVGRRAGKVCFVPGSCPGDQLQVRVTTDKRSYQIAEITQIVTPSPRRIPAECPLFGVCGGCFWQHIGYSDQLQAKKRILVEAMWRGARVAAEQIDEVVPSPQLFGYRSRVQFKLHQTREQLEIGFFQNGSHRVVDAPDGCLIALPIINQVVGIMRKLLDAFPEKRALTQLTVDCAENGVIAIVHYNGKDAVGLESFLASRFSELAPVSGLYLQCGAHSRPKRIVGDETLSYSLPFSKQQERVCRLSYFPGGFSQVNREQNRALRDLVVAMLAVTPQTNLLDLYCGNGNFSLPLSDAVASVTGIEASESSIAAARHNVVINSITNAEYLCVDAGAWVRQAAAAGRRFDSVLLDPPRAGAAELVRDVCRLQAEEIVYISCDPSTMARDCGIFVEQGYRVERCVPVDMFPQTYHLESICLLKKSS